MKHTSILYFIASVFILASCKKEKPTSDTRNIQLFEKYNGTYHILTATSTEKFDIDQNGISSDNMLVELPNLKNSDVNLVISSNGRVFHLLWPEQYVNTQSAPQAPSVSYNLQGQLYGFDVT